MFQGAIPSSSAYEDDSDVQKFSRINAFKFKASKTKMHIVEKVSSDVQSSSCRWNRTLPVQTLSFRFSLIHSSLLAFFHPLCFIQAATLAYRRIFRLFWESFNLDSGWADGGFFAHRYISLKTTFTSNRMFRAARGG